MIDDAYITFYLFGVRFIVPSRERTGALLCVHFVRFSQAWAISFFRDGREGDRASGFFFSDRIFTMRSGSERCLVGALWRSAPFGVWYQGSWTKVRYWLFLCGRGLAGLWCAARVGDGVARMRCTHSGDGIYAMASKARRAELYEFDNAIYLSRSFSEDCSRAQIARPLYCTSTIHPSIHPHIFLEPRIDQKQTP